MKKIGRIQTLAIASLSALALAAPVAFAQSGKTGTEGQQSVGQERGGKGGFGHRGGGRRGGHRGGMMFRGLDLTEAQKATMKQIHESHRQRTASLREQLRGQRGEGRMNQGETFNEQAYTQKLIAAAPVRAKLMSENLRLRQEILAVLTPEQKAQMEAKRAEHKARKGEMRGNRGNRSGGSVEPQEQ